MYNQNTSHEMVSGMVSGILLKAYEWNKLEKSILTIGDRFQPSIEILDKMCKQIPELGFTLDLNIYTKRYAEEVIDFSLYVLGNHKKWSGAEFRAEIHFSDHPPSDEYLYFNFYIDGNTHLAKRAKQVGIKSHYRDSTENICCEGIINPTQEIETLILIYDSIYGE